MRHHLHGRQWSSEQQKLRLLGGGLEPRHADFQSATCSIFVRIFKTYDFYVRFVCN